MKKVLLAAVAAVALAVPAGVASAHEDYYGYFHDQLDNREHERFHEEFGDAHAEAHAEGFRSPQEHRDWHRAYNATHERFHDDHPYADDDDGDRTYYRYRPSYYYYDRGDDYAPASSFGFSWSWR